MALFINTDRKLIEINEVQFKLEKEIQSLIETNLNLLMGLDFIKSEFTIKGRRIDTLTYDPQSMSFVIIEYKRDKNISVIDQGFTYLSLMLENKADFIIEYNEKFKSPLKRDSVDWSQTRVIFVAPSFNENQIQATNFKDIAIELWEVKQFKNNIITINPIRKSSSAPSIKPITQKNQKLKIVTEQLKTYSEQDHISKGSSEIAELYDKYKNAILNLTDDIEARPLKVRISFRHDQKIIADIAIFRNYLKLWINLKKGKLDDPKKITKDVSQIGHWGRGEYQLIIKDDSNLEYIMSLVKQAI